MLTRHVNKALLSILGHVNMPQSIMTSTHDHVNMGWVLYPMDHVNKPTIAPKREWTHVRIRRATKERLQRLARTRKQSLSAFLDLVVERLSS